MDLPVEEELYVGGGDLVRFVVDIAPWAFFNVHSPAQRLESSDVAALAHCVLSVDN